MKFFPSIALPRRRLKTALLPVGAVVIILLAFLRIAQDLIGFIYLLELLLSRFLVLSGIRMIFARELSKRALDFILRGALRDA
jgi:hypothetical protein